MIEEILDLCLKEIRAKRATVRDCLKKYPQYADELEPLLRTAGALEAAPEAKPSLAFKLRTRAQLAQLSAPASARPFAFFTRWSFATAAAILLVVLGLSSGLVYSANDSLPDSPLYPIKRTAESVQILFAPDSETRARTYMTFAERRLDEAKALANKPESSALAEQAIAEYNTQVDASLAAAPLVLSSATGLTHELTNRIARQQDSLKTLDKKVSASALEKALSGAEKAREKLNALIAPSPTAAPPSFPVSSPTSMEPTQGIKTPLPIPTTTPNPLAPTASAPATAMPVLTSPISLPTITLPAPTPAVPTVVIKLPTEIPVTKIPPIQPPPIVPPPLPTIRLP